jgi:hypothetical protein
MFETGLERPTLGERMITALPSGDFRPPDAALIGSLVNRPESRLRRPPENTPCFGRYNVPTKHRRRTSCDIGFSRCLEKGAGRNNNMMGMADAYGRAVIEERLKPRQFAEIAAYVRREYGPGIGPGFLLAEVANGTAGKPRKRPGATADRVIHAIAKAVRALVPGNGHEGKASSPTR